ncbi:MAG: Coenzyme F420 hydrogenase/dehydrogenase, beta subunit C-terminal domain [Clostridia bacterium]|nr:Coenzyme F420 hydrogenase/dehydrogenase, beta subunit C-terminal domain [Clostridia bacterium]
MEPKHFDFDSSRIKAYSGYYSDSQKLKRSASGGVAGALSELVIQKGGAVFGVRYTADFRGAEYACAQTLDELEPLRGSKYIDSSRQILWNGERVSVYAVVEEMLKNGRDVLFFGLGCTVAALYSLLDSHGVDTANLYTIELLCHGPTPAKVAELYLEGLEKKYGGKIVDFSVRYKKKGWVPPYLHAVFDNGKVYDAPFYSTDYGYAFSLYSKKGCYQCHFRGDNHKGDLTVGDYWGMTPAMEGYNPNGVSIILTQTEKGESLLASLSPEVFPLREADLTLALQHNRYYYKQRKQNAKWDAFDKALATRGLAAACLQAEGKAKYWLRRSQLTTRLAAVMPAGLKQSLKKVLGRK